MFNVLLGTMLLSLIYNYIFKRNIRSNLNCGIFAWTGVSSDKFSPFLFNVLGVYNDTRGGDSCGVYFNKGSITGIKTEAKYEKLVKTKKLHTTIKPGKYPIVIGHCRKASVGTVSEMNVQPTLLRDSTKNDKLVYVQAHNGTITNQRELATKYDIKIEKDESDSIVLSKLINKVGFKVLAEYEGSAALVIYFVKEPNVLYAFHGESKSYTVLTEERPLHFINVKGSGTYISSESSPLEFISNGGEVSAFKLNTVYKLSGDKVEEFQKIEREKAILKKYTGFNYNNTDEDTNNYYWTRQQSVITDNLIHTGITKNICCSNIETNFNSISVNTRIRYFKGFYMIGASYAHGEVIVDAWGYVRTPKLYEKQATLFYLYFFHGILLANKGAYDDLILTSKINGIGNSVELYIQQNFNKMSKEIAANSIHPFTRISNSPGSGYMEPSILCPNDEKYSTNSFFCGTFSPIFSDSELHFDNGDFIGYKKTNQLLNITMFLTDNYDFEDKLFFGLSGDKYYESINKKTDTKILSCEDCIEEHGYPNHEDCVKCNQSFKDAKALMTGVKVHDCLSCGDSSCAYFGQQDEGGESVECSSWISKDEFNDKRVTLCQTIATNVTPIIGDIDDLINELELTGCKEVVEKEFDIIVNANNKLKEIIK
jgi:hypothetical protein